MQVSDQIIAVLDNLCQKFGIAIDWSQQNILPYLQELAGKYITYEICTSITWCVITAVIMIISIILAKMSFKWDCEELMVTGVMVAVICVGLFLLTAATQAFDIVECLTIPEKTLIEYVSYLMKSK